MNPRANILITSAGRRVELFEAFQQSLAMRIPGAKAYCADLDPSLSSACVAADSMYMLPHALQPEYPDALLQLCRDLNIGMVIPTIDTELSVLAGLRERFAEKGIHVIIGTSDLIALCRDKRQTPQLYQRLCINTLQIYDRASIHFPCFSKPCDGSSSVGAMRLDSADQLTEDMLAEADRMFMELAPPGWIEVTVDLYFDRESQLQCVVPRERIATRSGEVSKGCTRKTWLYDELVVKLSRVQGAIGCLTLQVFADQGAQRSYAIEINPRFGGGYPLSYAAGADFPGWLIDEYFLNKRVEFHENWKKNLLMLRYDGKVLVENYDA